MNEQYQNRISVGVSSQVSLIVSGENIFRQLQERVMKWAFAPERNLRGIPDEAWQGKSFEIDYENSERAAAIALDDPKYWAFRLSERLKDTNRIWTTEVGIAIKSEKEAIFGCRLMCSQRGTWTKTPRSIPTFIRSIAFTKNAFLDGRMTSAEPWVVSSDGEVDTFVEFILDANRRHPVVVFALPDGDEDPANTIISTNDFIRKTVGYVHTVVLTSEASIALTRILGFNFSVDRSAVRTYWPGLSPDTDLWSDHPLASADRIRGWQNEDQNGFVEFLIQQSLRQTRPREVLERDQPPFQKIKLIAAEAARLKARKDGRSDEEIVALEDALKAATEESRISFDLSVDAENQVEQTNDILRQLKGRYRALQARVEDLQYKLVEGQGKEEEAPVGFDQIQHWAERNLSGSVELHDRAVKSLISSGYQNTGLVYDSLKMLRDFYVPMRRSGGNDLVESFRTRLAELGLENTKCFKQENKAKNFGGDYFVRYQGEERELNFHLKGPNSRDGRYGFRLYYFWDAESSCVVVGDMPRHLRNDLT